MFRRFINDVKKYYNYARYSAKSELKAEVAGSYLNWVWWILDPVCFMLIYTFMFGYVFKASEQYFPAFIFIGLTAWDFFNKNIQQSVKLIKKNKAIVSKVYIPKFILIISKMSVNGFKMLISFGLVVTLMIVFRVNITFNVFYVIPIMMTLLSITFGCMTILMHLGVFVEDLSNVVTIVLRFVFYMTGVFYSVVKRVPEPYGEIMLKANPIALVLNSLRQCLLYGETPARKLLLFWFVVGLAISAIGVRIIYRNENSYVKVI